MAWFFVYEVTSTKYTRDWKKEILIALYENIFFCLELNFVSLPIIIINYLI